ncbi:hypothetical protein E6R60_26440 [Streptomyces sp. A0642]|uniref:hypothetical protein n=1 Tax=Streptomyces sp. A0642 TaxID=2563100 RepID=UPI0010A21E84|nr:hypothetical protein [Streptomyces sp. A0642]THA72472.1 hypothetical protein E6R60_26440 [Streptomyces sp. A0642]
MVTTTPKAAPEIPEHIQEALASAEKAGWDVERRSLSVVIIPPKGSRQTFSLTTPMAPPQLKKKLADMGLLSAVKKQDEAASDAPDTDQKEPAGLVCPECQKPFRNGAGLGSHRRKSHGVLGTKRNRPTGRPAAKVPTQRKKAAPVANAATAPVESATEPGIGALATRLITEIQTAARAEFSAELKAKGDEIALLKAKVEELQKFKDAVMVAAQAA